MSSQMDLHLVESESFGSIELEQLSARSPSIGRSQPNPPKYSVIFPQPQFSVCKCGAQWRRVECKCSLPATEIDLPCEPKVQWMPDMQRALLDLVVL